MEKAQEMVVKPIGICFDYGSLFNLDTSTGTICMASSVTSLEDYWKHLHLFGETFGLQTKTSTSIIVEIVESTSFPGSSLFLPRESTLVTAGHVSMYTNQIRTGSGSLTYLCQNCLWRRKLLCLTNAILKVKQVIRQRSCLIGASFLSELLWVQDVDWEGSLLIFTTFLNNRQQPVSA